MITPEILPTDSTGVTEPAAAHAGHVHGADQREAGQAGAPTGVHACAFAGDVTTPAPRPCARRCADRGPDARRE